MNPAAKIFGGGGWRAVWILVVGLLALPTAAPTGGGAEAPPPSIILIMVDTLRADYLGAYGFQGDVSPHIDRFAAESIVFQSCFAQAPWTKPSIASLFTSLHVPVHGVRSHGGRFGGIRKERNDSTKTETLDEEATTLAEALRAGGYATGAFVANPWIRSTHGFGQGFDVFNTRGAGNNVTAERPFAAARKWIAKVAGKQPFFLYVHVMDVHGPYQSQPQDYESLRASPSLGKDQELDQPDLRRMPQYLRRNDWFEQDGHSTRGMRGHYAAGVRAFDRRLDAFFQKLRAKGVMDNAVVVMTSDHGEQLFEHGAWDHGNSLYDEELHVPLIVRLPRGKHAGRKVAHVVSLIDVMPTLLKLAGVGAVEGMQGRDLIALVDSRQPPKQRATFATAVKWLPGLYSVRTDSFKLIKDITTESVELYNLQRDAAETRDVARRSSALESMEGVLGVHIAANARHDGLEPGTAEMPAEVRERLRALGYEQ